MNSCESIKLLSDTCTTIKKSFAPWLPFKVEANIYVARCSTIFARETQSVLNHMTQRNKTVLCYVALHVLPSKFGVPLKMNTNTCTCITGLY